MKLFEFKAKGSKKILFIHGAYMSSWNMTEVAKYCQSKGISSYVVDLNPKKDMKITYKKYIIGLKKVLNQIGKCTVCGISMGGMLATEICNEASVKKLILLSTPYLEMPTNNKFKILNLKMLPKAILTGKVQINAKDLLNTASKAVINEINEHATYEPLKVMQESGDFAKVASNIKKCKKKIVMAYGKEDYTVNQNAIKSIPKKIKVTKFKNMSHLLIHEKNKKKVFDFIVENV